MGGLSTEVAFLSRALKMPRIRQVAPDMAHTARAEGWDPLELLVKVLAEEVTARETHGGQNRIRAARFPQTKTLDDFDFAHQRSVSRAQIAHLHQLDFVREAHNVIFLGPPGTGKTHLSIALGSSSSPPRLPSRVRDRHTMGHPTLRSQNQREPHSRTRTARPHPPHHHRPSSATSPSTPKPRRCSSPSSHPATNADRSSSHQTKTSPPQQRSSATQ